MTVYEFIRIQYQFFKTISAEQVRAFAPKYITAEQAEEIVSNA